MKKNLLVFIFLFSTAFAGKAQNLVPNGDFEQYYSCPTTFGMIDTAINWNNPTISILVGGGGGTPDYLHTCATSSGVSIPLNNFGYQLPHSGSAYAGVELYYPGTPNYREYIEVSLTSPLNAGTCYNLQLFVSASNGSQYMSPDISAYFSNTFISGINYWDPLPFTPQVNNPSGNVFDTLAWKLVSLSYTASGGESYMIIGNFKNDANTTYSVINNNAYPQAYVYIDDVTLTPCTGIEEQTAGQLKIYPNPVKNELRIKNAASKIEEIKIFDVMGKEILKTETRNHEPEVIINTSNFEKGIYIIELNGVRKKFIKE